MAAQFEVRLRDGTLLGDVASIASEKKVWRRLNRPAGASFTVPSYLVSDIQSDGRPLICEGYRQVMVSLDATGLFFNGIIWSLEDQGDEDMAYTRVTCIDPMVYWNLRPARDADGDFSDPSFLADFQTGPQIIQALLDNSENAGGGPPTDAEGPTFVDFATGTFETGGADLSGAPTNWPMTIGEIATLLTNTGELDIVLEPVDSGDVMAQVNCYNGDFGTNLTGSVNFDYGVGDFNIRSIRRTGDMNTIGNKIWYYLGPRLDQQHWRSNVTGDHPDLPNPPGGDVDFSNPLGDLINASRDELGVFMDISVYDNFGSGEGGAESSVYPLFLRLWQVESLLRVHPRQMVYVTPIRGEDAIGTFDIGDLVGLNIGPQLRLPVSSQAQRIYGYEISIDDDDVEALGEFQCSPDQDQI